MSQLPSPTQGLTDSNMTFRFCYIEATYYLYSVTRFENMRSLQTPDTTVQRTNAPSKVYAIITHKLLAKMEFAM